MRLPLAVRHVVVGADVAEPDVVAALGEDERQTLLLGHDPGRRRREQAVVDEDGRAGTAVLAADDAEQAEDEAVLGLDIVDLAVVAPESAASERTGERPAHSMEYSVRAEKRSPCMRQLQPC